MTQKTRPLLTLTVLALLSALTPARAATELHRYLFKTSTVADSVGTANGTLFNGAAVQDGWLVFDGVNDYVEFASKLVPTGTGAFSVSFFAQRAAASAGSFSEIISQGQSSANAFYIGERNSDHRVRAGDTWQSTGAAFPSDGQVHHFAVTADNANAQLYIDGVLAATKGSGLPVGASGTNTRLGRQLGGNAEYFNGRMTDLRIFSGVLSPAEVDAVFQPAVATASATNLTGTSATLQGSVNPRGETVSVYFEFGPTTLYGSTTTPQTFTGNSVTNVSAPIAGLAQGGTYHYRLAAKNAGRTRFANDIMFQTTPAVGENPTSIPAVTTGSASNITATSATVAGAVTPNGGSTQVQVEFGLTTNYGNVSLPQSAGNGTTSTPAALQVTGLQPLTAYHYRLIATNSLGTNQGADLTFTTAGVPPEVHTLDTTEVASTSATLKAQVIPNSGATSVAFLFGISPAILDQVAPVPGAFAAGTDPQSVTLTLPKGTLTSQTTYYYRSVATSGAGTVTATEVKSFTTQNVAPVANTGTVFFTSGAITIPVGNLATDADGNALTATIEASGQQFGTATVNGDGTAITYKPRTFLSTAVSGDTFSFNVSDGASPNPGTAAGTVTVYSFNLFKGSYTGLIQSPLGGVIGTGTLDLALDGLGFATYKLVWQGQQYAGKGQIQRDGSLVVSEQKLPPSGATLDLSFTLKPDPNALLLTCTLSDDFTAPPTLATATLSGVASTDRFDASDLPASGVFTTIIDTGAGASLSPSEAAPEAGATLLPRGFGYANLNVGKDKKRSARIIGGMPDARVFSSGLKGLRAALAAAGGRTNAAYQLYNDKLYGRTTAGPRGLVTGALGFDRDLDRFDSDLNWQRGRDIDGRFPQGFQTGLAGFYAALSSIRYPRPPKAVMSPPGFNLSSNFNALISFSDGDLQGFARKAKLKSNGSRIVDGTALPSVEPQKIKIKISVATGTFNGSFVHPDDVGNPPLRKPPVTKFNGVFQNVGGIGSGKGVFFGPSSSTSGSIVILPQDSN
jgi:hypothetical protein